MGRLRSKAKEISLKMVLYTLIFTFLCVINQRIQTTSVLDGWRESFQNMVGFAVAALILLAYKKEDFQKCRIYHLLWCVLGTVACVLVFLLKRDEMLHMNYLLVIVTEIFIWGFVVIQTIYSVVGQKKMPRLHKGMFAIWALMMLFMIFSRSDETWPLWYGVFFLCYYFTDFTQQDRENIFQGMLNGLILAFFVFQAHCFLYRPYDDVRYRGWFSNPNNNVLFYCFVLMAVLVKLYLCYKNKANKWWCAYYWLGVGTVLSFIVLTIGRMGWILAFVLVVSFLLFQKKDFSKPFLKYGCVTVLVTIIAFPLCFAAIRYLPPIRHHVVWFYGEYGVDKVHSMDPWDSEKFIDIDEFAEAAVGRIAKSIGDLLNNMPWVMKAEAAGLENPYEPKLSEELKEDGYAVRSTIYKTFFKSLNLRGYPSSEIGFQLTSDFWVYHAHNIFLQYGIQFGIPVLVLFTVLIFFALKKSLQGFWATQSPEKLCCFYLVLVPALFGMLEYTWGVGQMAIVLLFMAWRSIIMKEEKNMY